MTTATIPSTTARPAARPVLAGRVVSGVVVAFLLLDAGGKLFRSRPSVEGTLGLGFADHHVVVIGAVLAVGLALHLVPRTALLGAVYLTAYLGGAVAAHLRVDNVGSIVFTVAFGVTLWAGYLLRDARVRALVIGR